MSVSTTEDVLSLGGVIYVVDEGDYMTYGFAGPDAEAKIERWSLFGEDTFDFASPGVLVA